jgi:hypothetical protein
MVSANNRYGASPCEKGVDRETPAMTPSGRFRDRPPTFAGTIWGDGLAPLLLDSTRSEVQDRVGGRLEPAEEQTFWKRRALRTYQQEGYFADPTIDQLDSLGGRLEYRYALGKRLVGEWMRDQVCRSGVRVRCTRAASSA